MRTFEVSVKGEPVSFSSSLSDLEAHHLLVNVLANTDTNNGASDFAKSLASKDVAKMSKSQIAWVHRLVLNTPMKMSRTVAFMAPISKLTFDKFCLVKTTKTDVIRVMGGKGKAYTTYMGKIVPKTGAFWTSSNLTFEVAVDLYCMESGSDGPEGFVRESGASSGRCCMCGQSPRP